MLGECCDRVIALDADTKNSTFSLKFKEKFPERFIEVRLTIRVLHFIYYF